MSFPLPSSVSATPSLHSEEEKCYQQRCETKHLEQDQKGAKKVKQVTSNGTISTMYLQLPPRNKVSRLVLFNDSQTPEQKTTLIYIESLKESGEVLDFILKRKK